jgi:hypothetical protein
LRHHASLLNIDLPPKKHAFPRYFTKARESIAPRVSHRRRDDAQKGREDEYNLFLATRIHASSVG